MKILLADDSVTAQNMGKKILAEAGHEVVCVSNGAAALKKVAEQEPDLVILDIYMPGFSGLEVCQRLKEAPPTADLPILLTVGKLEPFRKEDAQRVRAEALIVKPFEASELAAAVGRFGEILAAKGGRKSAKVRSGKLGPQPKPKAKWDDVPEDDFVTTSQREMEQEDLSSPRPAEESSQEPLAGAEPRPASAFEDQVGAHTSPSPETESVAEFSVQAADEDAASARPASEPQSFAKAAAAAVGAGSEASIPEFNVGSSLPPSAPASSASSEASGRPAEAPPAVPASDMSAPAVPALSAAAADPTYVPEVDPAFEPDRTKWSTEFATRYGLAEEPESEAASPASGEEEEKSSEPTVTQADEAGSSAGAADEIAAILSSLPGGLSSSEQSGQSQESADAPRPWPLAFPAPGSWTAEEVPVEDQEGSVSLSEEMEKATSMAADTPAAQNIADREPAADASAFAPGQERENWVPPEAHDQAADTPAVSEAAFTPPPADTKPAQHAPDRVAGVMQSAAMAIATRAAVSAVAAQLHAQPARDNGDNDSAAGPSSIEDLVNNVLERMKPKLIAEIKRELGTGEEKK